MTEAYIYDALRTPRGKGRKDGALHEVTALRLSALTLNALKERNNIEGHAVEDVIWGNVTQVMEQGGNLARTAVLASDLDEAFPGSAIYRFCASCLVARVVPSISSRCSGFDPPTSSATTWFGLRAPRSNTRSLERGPETRASPSWPRPSDPSASRSRRASPRPQVRRSTSICPHLTSRVTWLGGRSLPEPVAPNS